MEQQVKDPALPLQQFGSLLWHGFNSWPGQLPHAAGVAKKKKKEKKVGTRSKTILYFQ